MWYQETKIKKTKNKYVKLYKFIIYYWTSILSWQVDSQAQI